MEQRQDMLNIEKNITHTLRRQVKIIALGRVRVDRYGRKRIDVCCPYCGGTHSHGWTPGNLERYSHCLERDPFNPVGGSYVLREAAK